MVGFQTFYFLAFVHFFASKTIERILKETRKQYLSTRNLTQALPFSSPCTNNEGFETACISNYAVAGELVTTSESFCRFAGLLFGFFVELSTPDLNACKISSTQQQSQVGSSFLRVSLVVSKDDCFSFIAPKYHFLTSNSGSQNLSPALLA